MMTWGSDSQGDLMLGMQRGEYGKGCFCLVAFQHFQSGVCGAPSAVVIRPDCWFVMHPCMLPRAACNAQMRGHFLPTPPLNCVSISPNHPYQGPRQQGQEDMHNHQRPRKTMLKNKLRQ